MTQCSPFIIQYILFALSLKIEFSKQFVCITDELTFSFICGGRFHVSFANCLNQNLDCFYIIHLLVHLILKGDLVHTFLSSDVFCLIYVREIEIFYYLEYCINLLYTWKVPLY